jgi:hypothetical protein
MKKEPSIRLRLKPSEAAQVMKMRNKKNTNILVIGDLHEPFCLDSYLDHCIAMYNEHNCSQVIFIGDVIDNHFSSYHETDANGLGGGDELELAIERIARWVKAFPVADVCIGNHDRIISRKAQSGHIPKQWIRTYSEVLNAPNWTFGERFVYDNVQYVHGEGGTARTKGRGDMMSTVQGHLHTQLYTDIYVGVNYRIHTSQIGCGIDHKKYAFGYAKAGKKPAISCMVMLNNGTQPLHCPMDLGK